MKIKASVKKDHVRLKLKEKKLLAVLEQSHGQIEIKIRNFIFVFKTEKSPKGTYTVKSMSHSCLIIGADRQRVSEWLKETLVFISKENI